MTISNCIDASKRAKASFTRFCRRYFSSFLKVHCLYRHTGNDSNLLIVFYVQIMPDDFVMQLHR
ncbi:hypothetical protein ACTZQT_27645, partial [Klebsiella pneumoniae]